LGNPNPQFKDRLFVITGGPGVGKTAILRELERRGICCVPEVARQIIQQQVRADSNAVPWMNTERYAPLMLEKSIQDYSEHAEAEHVTIFDRGVLDSIGYMRHIGLLISDEIYQRAIGCRYNVRVFIPPPWREIYHTDSERKQTFEEAVIVDRLVREVFSEHGYKIIDIPQIAIEKRADFVLSFLKD
jgi:predicted ATPase